MKKVFKILSFVIALSFVSCRLVFATEATLARPPKSPIYIKAVNPGYTIDGQLNVGEFIELAKAPGVDTPLSLAGFVLSYTNSSGNSHILYEFSEGSWMTGESILLRLASSPDSELADLVYTKTLALKAGPLILTKGETIIDYVCWNNKDGCATEFKAANPTTLVYEPGDFVHVNEYEPHYKMPDPSYEAEPVDITPEPEPSPEPSLEPSPEPVALPDEPDETLSQCIGLKFSEIFTYYVEAQSEQFIEFYNTTDAPINLEGCSVKYKNNFYPLVGTVQPETYFVRDLPDFSLTKNPSKTNTIELIDVDGTSIEELSYSNGQKKGASFAFVADADSAEFRITYSVTPGAENIYQQFKNCEEGKVINPLTGYCVKEATAATTEKACAEGSYLNPLTGRCKKIVVNDGADYELAAGSVVVGENSKQGSFIALVAVLVVVLLGLGFVIFEFRFEIKKCIGKVFRRFLKTPRRVVDHR